MRFNGFLGCGFVTLYCAAKAMGNEPQTIFSSGLEWLWWFVAFYWGVSAIRFALGDR